VPCGTGNDFIKTLKISREQLLDIDSILTAPSIKVDFLVVDDHRCLNICNIGIDSIAAYYMQEFKRLPLMKGSMPYLFGVLKSLFGKLGNELKIRLDGKPEVTGNYMLIAIANGQYYGGGYRAAPSRRRIAGHLPCQQGLAGKSSASDRQIQGRKASDRPRFQRYSDLSKRQ